MSKHFHTSDLDIQLENLVKHYLDVGLSATEIRKALSVVTESSIFEDYAQEH